MGSGASGTRFGGDGGGLEAAVGEVLDGRRPVGLSMAAVRPGRVVWSASFGHADLAAGIQTAPDTAYLWFSMTKIAAAFSARSA